MVKKLQRSKKRKKPLGASAQEIRPVDEGTKPANDAEGAVLNPVNTARPKQDAEKLQPLTTEMRTQEREAAMAAM